MHILLTIIFLLIINVAQAQIYTWVDTSGRTHYSDRPPQDIEADELNFGDPHVSTIGESGLRPTEREWLQDIRETKQQERLIRQIEAQNGPSSVNVVTVEKKSENQEPIRYYYTPVQPDYSSYYYRPHNGISFQLNYGYSPYSNRNNRENSRHIIESERNKPKHHFKPRRQPKFKASGIWPNKTKAY